MFEKLLKENNPNIDINRAHYHIGDLFTHLEGIYISVDNNLEEVRAICLKRGFYPALPGEEVIFEYEELPYTKSGERLKNKLDLSTFSRSEGFNFGDVERFDMLYKIRHHYYILYPNKDGTFSGIREEDINKEDWDYDLDIYIFNIN